MRNKKRVMVCVTQQKSCERLIKKGAELANDKHDEVYVIHVVKENWRYFGQLKESDALEYLFDISKEFDASLNVLKSKEIEETLNEFAEGKKIDVIVMGQSQETDAQQNMINRLQVKTTKHVKFEIVPQKD